jgi:uncharacterized protein YqeY
LSIKDRLQEDIKAAMRAKEAERLTTLRLVTAAIKQKEVDERIALDDAAVLSVLEKMIKQRKDSISQFAAGNRPDLVAKEQAELDLLAAYMPEQMSEADLDAAIAAAIAESGATGPQAMGKAMALLKPRLAGKADMSQVSQRLKARLTQ